MGSILLIAIVAVLVCSCVAPPVTKNKEQPNEQVDPDGLENYMEYHRYLREVVNTLESDPDFKQKLEKASEDDIRSGNIAHELEFVNHHVRTQLDEIKRTELERLRHLTERKNELIENNSIDDPTHHHLDHSNPHTFEIDDLKKLIAKTTEDLAVADRKRHDDFKQYELQKEFQKQDKLNHTTGDERIKLENEIKENEEKHKNHDKLHEPGHKQQLEEVWEEQDHMQQDFDPKTFFMLHDLDSNGLWDETEVKALFIKELDKMYAAGAPEDDMKERAEEMELMRESVFREVDTNRDGFIDYNEFLAQTKRNDFQQDHGWQGLDEQKVYTDEELDQYIKQHQAQAEQAYYQQMPPQGMAHPGQVPPGHYPPHGNQVPPGGYQVPPGGYQVPPGGYQVPPGGYQVPPGGYQVPPGGYQVPPGGSHPNGGPSHAQLQPGQTPQVHTNSQQIPNQQGKMPDLNTNEVYKNQGQQQHQQQYGGQQQNIGQQQQNIGQHQPQVQVNKDQQQFQGNSVQEGQLNLQEQQNPNPLPNNPAAQNQPNYQQNPNLLPNNPAAQNQPKYQQNPNPLPNNPAAQNNANTINKA